MKTRKVGIKIKVVCPSVSKRQSLNEPSDDQNLSINSTLSDNFDTCIILRFLLPFGQSRVRQIDEISNYSLFVPGMIIFVDGRTKLTGFSFVNKNQPNSRALTFSRCFQKDCIVSSNTIFQRLFCLTILMPLSTLLLDFNINIFYFLFYFINVYCEIIVLFRDHNGCTFKVIHFWVFVGRFFLSFRYTSCNVVKR